MKTQSLRSAFCFVIIFFIALCVNLKVSAQIQTPQSPDYGDPHRGISVDNFVTFTNQSLNSAPDYVIDTANTILSVWTPARGYYKEIELLEYCRDNHITHLMLYNLVKVFKPSYNNPDYRAHAWDNGTQIMQPLTWHLCRFMGMAYSPQYGITEISAAGSTSEFLTDVISPSPAFHFTQAEKNSPGFNPELLFVEDANNNGTYAAEVTKYFLTVLGMGANCEHCDQHLTSITFEDEFWNGSGSFDDISVALKDLYFLKLLNNTLHPDHQILIEMYLGALHDGSTSWSTDMIAAYLDGCTSCKAFFDISGNSNYDPPHPRIVDKILPTVFQQYVETNTYALHFAFDGQASCYTPYVFNSDPNTCGGIVNYDHTLIYPYMNAECRELGGKADFLGTWLQANIQNNSNNASGNCVHNIFSAEKQIYASYLENENPPFDCAFDNAEDRLNFVYTGGVQWYAASQMYKALAKPITLTTNCPCETTDQVQLFYQGPAEAGTGWHLTINDPNNYDQSGVVPELNCDIVTTGSGVTFEDQVQFPAVGSILTPGNYTAMLTLTYASGITYAYSKKIKVLASGQTVPTIEIVNSKTGAATTDTRCEGEQVTLKVNAGTLLNWFKDNVPLTVNTNGSTYITDADVGTHRYKARFGTGAFSSEVVITWHQNPNIFIVADAADCGNIGNGDVHLHAITLGNGASGGLTYKWSTGEEGPDISAHVTDYGWAINQGNSHEYQVTVTNTNSPLGCSRTASYFFSNEPGINTPPTVIVPPDPTSFCTTTGATTRSLLITPPPVDPPTYISFLTPGNIFEGSLSPSFSNLAPGTYNYYVTPVYNKGCGASGTFQVNGTFTLTEDLNQHVNASGCHGIPVANLPGDGIIGSFRVQAFPVANYNYTLWPDGTQINSNGFVSYTNLFPGIYRVEAEDAAGCKAFIEVTITYDYDAKPVISHVGIDNNLTCGLPVPSDDGHMRWNSAWGLLNATQTSPYVFNITTPICPSCSTINQTTTSLEMINMVAGSYIFTLTDANGCQAQKDFYISNPPELHAEVSADASCDNPVNSGVIYIDPCGGAGNNDVTQYTYALMPALGTQVINAVDNTVKFTDLPPNPYTVTVTDPCGTSVSSYIVVLVQPCCSTVAVNVTIPTSGLFINANTIYTNQTIDVNGNIDIQGSYLLTLDGCTLNFAPGIAINVLPQAQLTVTNSTLQPCHENWQGINAYDYSTVTIGTNSHILGANIGLDALHRVLVSITASTFDNNDLDILLHEATFNDAVITGNQFLYSALAAYDPTMPEAHIRIENVDGVTIGGAAALTGRNHFEKKQYGIKAAISNVNIYNNEFYNCGVSDAEVINTYGGGVYSKGGGSASSNTLDVFDNGGRTLANYFYQCYTGVEGYELSRAVVENNTGISATDGGFKKCKHAVIINNTHIDNTIGYIYNISVANNEMEQYRDGISCIGMDRNIGFNISDNLLNYTGGSALSWDGPFKHGYKAINVQNFRQDAVRGVIKNNLISNTSYGVHLRNIVSRNYGDVIIGDINAATASNKVDYLGNVMGVNSAHCFGFWFEDCDLLEIDKNVATCNQTPATGIDKAFRGFSVDNTTNSIFCTNQADKLGSGFRVNNICDGSYFLSNNTNNNWDNFHLVNASLPDQDVLGNDLQNAWAGAGSGYDFAGSLAGGVVVNWYTNASPIISPGAGLQFLIINLTATSVSDCQPAHQAADDGRKEKYGSAVTDTTDYGQDFPEENKYADKQGFYNEAKKDSTILTLGLPDDYVFQNAFDSLDETNIGKISDVKVLLDSGNTVAAITENNSITPINQAEINSKAIHELLVAYETNGYLDSAQKIQGHELAIQTIVEGGVDGFIIRALLNEDIIDDLEASTSQRKAHPQTNTSNDSQVLTVDGVHPNPARSEVTFTSNKKFGENNIIVVYDLLQRKVAEYKLTQKSSSFTFDVSKVQQGIYLVRHLSNDEVESENKLVIIR